MTDAKERLLDALARDESVPARRGLVGAAAWPQRAQPWSVQVAERARLRSERPPGPGSKARPGLARFRDFRYVSGPWEAGSGRGTHLPVAWFALWRSNVRWVPDPAMMEKRPSGRGPDKRPERGSVARPERPDPLASRTRPAQARERPRQIIALRRKPSTEE
jgi:hypothetical protein